MNRNTQLNSIQSVFFVQQHKQLIIMHEISNKSDKKKENANGNRGGLQLNLLVFRVK